MTEFTFKGYTVEVNQKVPLQVEGKIYDQMDGENFTNYTKDFELYRWKKGKGHKSKLLFAKPNSRIQKGENEIYLKKADYEKWNLDLRGENTAREKIGLESDTDLNPVSFTRGLPANTLDVEGLLMDLNGEEVKELIDLYLQGSGAAEIDEDILYVLRPYLFHYESDTIRPGQAMPSNPHGIIYTNPYVGKSTTFDKIGRKADYCTPAKVLGWSGAENSSKGSLDGLTKSFGIDELNESGREEKFLKRGFLPLMRNGKYKAEQGHGVATETWAPLLFMSNPKESETAEDLVSRFRENLSKLSDNYGALGSRLGVIVYGDNFETVKTGAGDWERKEKAGKVVKTIFDLASEKFSQLVKKDEVQRWLKQDFPEQYSEEIENRRDELKLPEVKKFWAEHLNANSHSRGHALRNACIDHLPELVNDEYSIKEVLDSADQHFSRLTEINRESLRNICSMIDEGVLKDIAKKDLENLEPKYMRFFAYGVIATLKEKEIASEEYNPLETVRKPYLNHREKFIDDNDAQQYQKFARIKDYVKESGKTPRKILKSKMGVEITEIEGTVMWRISNSEKFNHYLEAGILNVHNEHETGESTQSTSGTSGKVKVKLSDKEKIIKFVEQLSLEDENAERKNVIEASSNHMKENKADQIIENLISEGILYEPKPGKLDKL